MRPFLAPQALFFIGILRNLVVEPDRAETLSNIILGLVNRVPPVSWQGPFAQCKFPYAVRTFAIDTFLSLVCQTIRRYPNCLSAFLLLEELLHLHYCTNLASLRRGGHGRGLCAQLVAQLV